MTGADFYTYVLETFKRTDKSTEIYKAINDAVQTIVQTYPFEDYKSASYNATIPVLGNYTFDLPADFDQLVGEIQMIDGSIGGQLTQISRSEYQRMFADNLYDSPFSGWPTHYNIFGGKVYVGPVPDNTAINYYFDYTLDPSTPITSVTASVPFTNINRKMLKHMTLSNLYNDLEEFDLADQHFSDFQIQYDLLVTKEEKITNPYNRVNYRDI